DTGIADSVSAANDALQKINTLNGQLGALNAGNQSAAALQDQRDQYIDQLSQLMDIRVVTSGNNQVTVFTNSGVQLVGAGAAQLSFTPQGTITPQTQWNADPTKSTLGSLMLVSPNGTTIDLTANQSIRSGKIAAYLDMRDNVLVQAQNQIDSLAGSLSQAMSSETINGVATPPGPTNGFTVDTSGMLNGNQINLTYTDTV